MLDTQDFKGIAAPAIEEQISWVTPDVQAANVRRIEIAAKTAQTWVPLQLVYGCKYFRVPMTRSVRGSFFGEIRDALFEINPKLRTENGPSCLKLKDTEGRKERE